MVPPIALRRGRTTDLLPDDTTTTDDDGDLHPPPDATLADALAAYWAEIDVANRNLAGASLDDVGKGEPDPGHSVRRTIVHMIEEYARHCGHADLLRQAIDGTTGD